MLDPKQRPVLWQEPYQSNLFLWQRVQGSYLNRVLIMSSMRCHRIDRWWEGSLSFARHSLMPIAVAKDSQLITLLHSLHSSVNVKRSSLLLHGSIWISKGKAEISIVKQLASTYRGGYACVACESQCIAWGRKEFGKESYFKDWPVQLQRGSHCSTHHPLRLLQKDLLERLQRSWLPPFPGASEQKFIVLRIWLEAHIHKERTDAKKSQDRSAYACLRALIFNVFRSCQAWRKS